MLSSLSRMFYGITVPALIILASFLLSWFLPDNGGKELNAFLVILPIVPYAVFLIGAFMGVRFNNSGLILGSVTLAFSYYIFSLYGPLKAGPGYTKIAMTEFLAVFVPLNFLIFSFMTKRRIFTKAGVLWSLFLVVQSGIMYTFFYTSGVNFSRILWLIDTVISHPTATKVANFGVKLSSVFHSSAYLGLKTIPTAAFLSFVIVLLVLAARLIKNKDPMFGGFAGSIIALLLASVSSHGGPAMTIYFSAAGLILVISAVERSFSMAYLDDLTGLPARRSLNEALLNLGKKYSIAMVDVDHFKKFNDTYGHETGDQVLKMLAAKFSKISGGGKTFRYGGEEFTAIFPGKRVEEAIPHLEEFRKGMENTPFLVRGKDRDKKNAKERGKKVQSGGKRVKVTVSIGIAEPGKGVSSPDDVIKEADKALYRAKEAGRNRIRS